MRQGVFSGLLSAGFCPGRNFAEFQKMRAEGVFAKFAIARLYEHFGSKTSANFIRVTPSRLGSTNKFSVDMKDVLPPFGKRIAKEQAHILQKSDGPLSFGFLPFLAVFFGVKEVV